MKTNINNIIELISRTEKGKYNKYLPEKDKSEIKTFESTQEHIFDIYNIRQQNISENGGKNIIGLNELLKEKNKLK